ncbi:MAG: LysR family transcriptional regulator [Deltaproteobacteria bacterium]|nr:LysR family transcriptional regulator [Deltaproteobacteria bacterium]
MNFTHLKAFYSVAVCNGFTQAAQMLNISQSTLSLQVQSLEKKHSLSLIKRNKRAFELTDEGRVVFEFAREIFSLADNLNSAIEDLKISRLKIGSTPTLAHYIIPGVIMAMKRRNPELKYEIYTGLSRELLTKVINFEYHAALIGRIEYPDNVISRNVAEPKLYFISAKPKGETIRLADLADYPIILPERGSATREYIIREFERREIPLNICMDCENSEAIRNMVQLGMGGAFFPLYGIAQDVLEGKYHKSAIVEELHLTIDIVFLKERRTMKVIRDFVAALRNQPF